MEDPVRIACWSGPRNVSTALLRAFGNRADCAVVDEPLYAAYLTATGKKHPGRTDVIGSQSTDAAEVAAQLTGPIPGDRLHWYQKHMSHHLLDGFDGDWLDALAHVFLVRDPAEMLSSLLRVWPDAELEDTGLVQQVALFDRVADHTGKAPVVLDGRDVMDEPGDILQQLCRAIDLPWDPAMLNWPTGPRDTDGVWGQHWYASLWASTGFVGWRPRQIRIPEEKRYLLDATQPLYDRLVKHRLTPSA
jgi:hypothetical protein